MRYTFKENLPTISNAKGRLLSIGDSFKKSGLVKVLNREPGAVKYTNKSGSTSLVELNQEGLPKRIELSSSKGKFVSEDGVQTLFSKTGATIGAYEDGHLEVMKPNGDIYISDVSGCRVLKKNGREIRLKEKTFYDRVEKELNDFDAAKELTRNEIQNSEVREQDSDLLYLFADSLKHGGVLNHLDYIK